MARIDEHHRIDLLSGKTWRTYRRNCQVVFQDSFSSLNPRQLVKDIVGRPLKVYKEASGQDLTEFWTHWFDQPDGADDFDATDLARLLREIGE